MTQIMGKDLQNFIVSSSDELNQQNDITVIKKEENGQQSQQETYCQKQFGDFQAFEIENMIKNLLPIDGTENNFDICSQSADNSNWNQFKNAADWEKSSKPIEIMENNQQTSQNGMDCIQLPVINSTPMSTYIAKSTEEIKTLILELHQQQLLLNQPTILSMNNNNSVSSPISSSASSTSDAVTIAANYPLLPPPLHDRNYQAARYKTELCLHYRERNHCPHGVQCLFAHGLEELRPYRGRHPKHKTQRCKAFHDNGYCDYGYRCSYIHSESPRTIKYMKSLNRQAQTIRRNRTNYMNRQIYKKRSNRQNAQFQIENGNNPTTNQYDEIDYNMEDDDFVEEMEEKIEINIPNDLVSPNFPWSNGGNQQQNTVQNWKPW